MPSSSHAWARRVPVLVLGLVIASLVPAAWSSAAAAAGPALSSTNMLANSSFEATGGWNALAPAAGGVVNFVQYRDPAKAYESGTYAEMNTANPDGSLFQDVVRTSAPSSSFTFSLWLRSASATPVTGRLALWGIGSVAGLTLPSEVGQRAFTVGPQWTLVTTALNPTGAHGTLRAQIYVTSAGNLDLDGAQLTSVGLTNASFEKAGAWTTLAPAAGGIVDMATYQDASRAVEATGYGEMDTQYSGGSVYQDIAIASTDALSTVTFSIWLRSPSGVPVAGQVTLWGLGGTPTAFHHPFTVGAEWTLVSTTMTHGVGAASDHSSMRAQVYLDTIHQLIDLDGAQLVAPGLADSSFELGAPAQGSSAWQTLPVPGGKVVTGTNTITPYEPARYGSVAVNLAGDSIFQDVAVGVRPGEASTFSMWVRTEYPGPVAGRLVLWGLGGTSESGVTAFTVAQEWTLVSTALNPVSSGHTALRAQLYVDTPGRLLDLDAASLAAGNARPAKTVPGPPTGVAAVPGDATAMVSWNAPASVGRLPITGYTVTSAPGGLTCTTAGALSCSMKDLRNGTAYSFTVTATNPLGTGSPSGPSRPVTPRSAPGAPTGVTARAGNREVRVSWVAPPASNASPAATSYSVVSQPGGKTCTTTGALACVVTGLTGGVPVSFTVRATNAVGTGPPSVASPVVTPWSGSTFRSVVPLRILDSRTGTGGWKAPLIAGTPKNLTVTVDPVPADASAVVLNLTVTEGSSGSFLTAYPTGGPPPNASNLNFGAKQTISNLATVKVGAGGQISFANAVGDVQVIADVVGYYVDDGISANAGAGTPPGDFYNGVTPARILDSRTTNGGWNGKLTAAATRALTVAGVGGVPSTATAVVANVTVTNANGGSFLSTWPAGIAGSVTSSLNFSPYQTISNLTVLKVGTNGQVMFANAVGSTDVIVDVVGYFSPTGGARFHALSPTRILDDRVGVGLSGPWTAGQTRSFAVAGQPDIDGSATAVVMNTTVTNGTTGSFVTVFPDLVPRPNASSINFGAGQTIAGLTMPKLGSNGDLAVYNQLGSVDVIGDVVGWFAPS